MRKHVFVFLLILIILPNSTLFANDSQASSLVEETSSNLYEEAGTYWVTVSRYDATTGNYVETKVRMTVVKPYTILGENEGIDARDVLVDSGTLITLTDTEVLQLAGAHAWDSETGSAVPVTIETRTTYSQQPFAQEVTFTTQKGLKITVLFLEMSEPFIKIEENYLTLHENSIYKTVITKIVGISILMLSLVAFLLLIVFTVSRRRIRRMQQLLYRK